MLRKQQKKSLLKLTEVSELNSFTNMVVKIAIKALKIKKEFTQVNRGFGIKQFY